MSFIEDVRWTLDRLSEALEPHGFGRSADAVVRRRTDELEDYAVAVREISIGSTKRVQVSVGVQCPPLMELFTRLSGVTHGYSDAPVRIDVRYIRDSDSDEPWRPGGLRRFLDSIPQPRDEMLRLVRCAAKFGLPWFENFASIEDLVDKGSRDERQIRPLDELGLLVTGGYWNRARGCAGALHLENVAEWLPEHSVKICEGLLRAIEVEHA